jgi:NAD(P)-dependent dehydrogenase (short-subunit alcohol dehydrogenase family)
MHPRLDGRVAVITGGGGGIGLAFARRFMREGMKIVLTDIDAPSLEAAAEGLRESGGEVMTLSLDIADPEAVERLRDAVYDRFHAVHILCNNAGVVPSGRTRPVWDYAIEDWRWALNVNLIGVLNGIRNFVPRMMAGGDWGHVVNTASMAGLVSGPRSVVYSTSKHAVVRVSEALYASLTDAGSPIGTTVLCPGIVDTAIYRSERNRPADLIPKDGVAAERPDLVDAAAQGLEPDAVAEILFQAILNQQFYVLTSSAYDEAIAARTDALLSRRNPEFIDVFTVTDHPAAAG